MFWDSVWGAAIYLLGLLASAWWLLVFWSRRREPGYWFPRADGFGLIAALGFGVWAAVGVGEQAVVNGRVWLVPPALALLAAGVVTGRRRAAADRRDRAEQAPPPVPDKPARLASGVATLALVAISLFTPPLAGHRLLNVLLGVAIWFILLASSALLARKHDGAHE